MSDDILKYLSDKLREEQRIMSEDMAMGKAKDFGDYKYACGIIRGLSHAESILNDLVQRMEKSEDE